MLRNWYAVYTKPEKEKIILSAFAKKRFESFCPIVNTIKAKSNNRKAVFGPLFMSHVFVYLSESEISTVKVIPGVLNILYWKSKPAIISVEEIDAIRYFTVNYSNIKLIKSAVNISEKIRVQDDPVFSFNEKTVSVKYQTVKVYLPSLGYTMVAERGAVVDEPVFQDSNLFRTFPRRLNSFFFN